MRKRLNPFWNEDNPFPFAISSQYMETLPALRPKLVLMTSQEDADEAVSKIEKEMMAKIREKMPQLLHLFEKSDGDAAGSSPTPNNANAALHTIDEDMEDEEDMVSFFTRLGKIYQFICVEWALKSMLTLQILQVSVIIF